MRVCPFFFVAGSVCLGGLVPFLTFSNDGEEFWMWLLAYLGYEVGFNKVVKAAFEDGIGVGALEVGAVVFY